MENFKKVLVDNLFAATRTEELSIGRLFEVVDTIAPYVLEAAKKYMMKDAVLAVVNTYEEIGGEGYVEFVANVPPSKYKEKITVKLIIMEEG